MKRIWRSFNFNIGRILAYIAVGLIIALFSSFLNLANVNAYVYVDTTEGQFKPYEATSAIKNPNSLWPNGNNFSSGSPWLRSIGQYWYGSGGLNGYYLNVSADYYLGIETLTTYTLPNFNWFTSTRNTLTADNLRCGIGSYGTGYDSTYAPVVTNFSVTLESGVSSQVNAHDVFHVKFNYSQQLSQTVNMNGSNMSCWFETNPSDGLFGQILANNLNATRYTSYTEKLTYSLSSSPEYSKLQDIEDSINDLNDTQGETNDKLDETNEKLDDLNDNITDTDTSGSEDLAGGFFEDFDNEDYGLSDIITMPLQVINNITSATCSPLELPLPFVDTDVALPCMYDIYEDHFGGFLTIYQTITFGIVAYWVCINIFRMVKNFKNPDNDEVEVLDL